MTEMFGKKVEKMSLPDIDLSSFTEAEREHIVSVVVKDFEIRANDRKRLNSFRKLVEDSILGGDVRIKQNNCSLCCREFGWFSNQKVLCQVCNRIVCARCSTDAPIGKSVKMCALCIRQNGLKAMNCEWFYEKFKEKFEDFGSSIIVKTALGPRYNEFKVISDFYLEPTKKSIIHDRPNNLDSKTLISVKDTQATKFQESHKELLRKINAEYKQTLSDASLSKAEANKKYIHLLTQYRNETQNLLETFANVVYISSEKNRVIEGRDMKDLTKEVLNFVRQEVEKIIKVPIDQNIVESYIDNDDPEDDGQSFVLSINIITPERYLAQVMHDRVKKKLENELNRNSSRVSKISKDLK